MREMMYLGLLLLLILVICLIGKRAGRYDSRGFDDNHIHKNGPRYDNEGYDYAGYDVNGYNRQGYNAFGKNRKGKYDRLYDKHAKESDGFCDPVEYPIALTTHARERLQERLGICDEEEMYRQTLAAYRFGKSRRQVRSSTAFWMEQIEHRHEDDGNPKVVLLYRNYVYLFSCDNKLVTVYENERIPM